MKPLSRSLIVFLGLAGLVAGRAAGQEVHEIQMIADGKRDFRFEPAQVNARRGDVLLFKSVSGGPHSVVFEGKDLPAAERQKLSAALPRRAGDLSSPLLTDGSEYRVVIPALTSGTYRFFCLPHRAYDMHGTVTVN